MIPYNQSYDLSAASSYDSNNPTTLSILQFSWSCSILTSIEYGKPCPDRTFIVKPLKSYIITIPERSLDPSKLYLFTVIATGSDSRSATSSIQIQSKDDIIGKVLLTSNFTTFSVSQKLVINAYIKSSATVPTNAIWSMVDDTNNNLDASFRKYAYDVLSDSVDTYINPFENIYFPIIFAPYTFIPKKSYTFQLLIQGAYDLYEPVYSRITLTAIAAPDSGIITCKPTQGLELNTTFNIGTFYWAIDSSAFPVSYSFFYEVSTTSSSKSNTRLTLRGMSEYSSINTQLPYINDNALQLIAVVTDKFGSSAEAYTSVLIHPSISSPYDLDNIVNTGIINNLKIGYIDNALQNINNAAIKLNTVNCSSISTSYCISLNRYNCSTVSHTCGACLPGYTGLFL
jgi:hypothetical protein